MKTRIILLPVFLICGAVFAQTKKPIPTPQVQFGQGVVSRISNTKDVHGGFLPPWKEIEIKNVFGFRKEPIVGEKVTVIPLDVDVAPLELRIVKAEQKRDGCDERLPPSWEIVLESIKQRAFFEIAPRPNRAQAFPFDVCVIYPAVKFAHLIKRNRLSKNMLPKGIAIPAVKGAIDLTNHGTPDLLIVEYCCGDPNKAAEQCDYTCGKRFKKIRSAWKLIDTSGPC